MRTGRSTPTESELAALADGSLEGTRGEQVLAQVSSSAELQSVLAEQRRAVDLMRALDERAPATVRASIEAMVPTRPSRRPSARWRVGLATAVVVALAAIIAIDLSGGGSSTTGIQRTATLVLSPATMPAPAESHSQRSELSASVDGVSFPYWRERFGWRSSGARSDRVEGRAVTTVFYSNGLSRRVGYAIVSGPAWTTRGGSVLWNKGVAYRVFNHDGATVVTWQRDGHLCVVSGRGVSTQALVRLAGWTGAKPVAA